MKKQVYIWAFLLALTLNMAVSTIGMCMADNSIGDSGTIQPSQIDEIREPWFDSRWHYRMLINVSSDAQAPLKKGRVVEYTLNLSSVSNLDDNSIRVVYGGVEIPSQYDPAIDNVTFVIEQTIGLGQIVPYTVYYDTIPNGLKPVTDYGSDWIEGAINTVESYDEDTIVQEETDEFLAANNMGETTDGYYYHDQVVYEGVDGNYYYENGTQVVGAVIEGELTGTYYYIGDDGTLYEVQRLGDQWNFTDGSGLIVDADTLNEIYVIYDVDGSTYEVQRDAVTDVYTYLVNGSVANVADFDVAAKVYIMDNETVFFDPVVGTWNYTDGGVLEMWAIYDPLATITWDSVTHTGLFVIYNSTSFAVALYDNATREMWVWDDSLGAYRQGTIYEVRGQTIYDGSEFQTESIDALSVTESMSVDSYDIGAVKATSSMSGSYVYDDGVNPSKSFREWILSKVYRKSPDVLINFNSDATGIKVNPTGKVFVNLGGVIDLGGDVIGLDEFGAWLEGELLDLGIKDSDIMDLYDDVRQDYNEIASSTNRIAVLTSDISFNVNDLDFINDSRVVNMTGKSNHNLVNQFLGDGAISIKVIPIILSSEYVALYDLITHQGIGIKFDGATNMINMLVEVWEVTTAEDIYNYVTIGFNYLGWDFDAALNAYKSIEEYAGYVDGCFDAIISYLSTIDPSAILDALFKVYETTDPSELYREGAIPINIIVHSPVPGQQVDEASDLVINITVAGETLDYAQYYLDVDGVLMSFDSWNDIILGNGNTKHVGKRMSAVRRIQGIDRATINIVAYDTSGVGILAQADIIVNGQIVDELVWTITIISGGFTLLASIALVKTKRQRNPKDCIGGQCNV